MQPLLILNKYISDYTVNLFPQNKKMITTEVNCALFFSALTSKYSEGALV